MLIDELVGRAAVDPEGLAAEQIVVVDLTGADHGASATLGSVPCVVVGVGSGRGAGASPAIVDVVADESELDDIRATVDAAPRASIAVALLLRGRDQRSLDEALVAESTTYSMLQAGPEFAAWRAATPVRPAPYDPSPAVRWERDGDVLRVVLDRPRRHNAYSAAMRDALVEALSVAAADEGLRVELSGAGPSFCSGGDLAEFGTFDDPASAHVVRLTRSAARLLARISARVTVTVHGACLGAGVELPAFAGRVQARADATFGLPEVALGLVPGAGGTASLPPRIGRHRTALLALTGRRIDASTALAWGLVDELV